MKKTRNIYTALIFIFLYMPIFVLVLYSFNSSNSTSSFEGFSFKWYKELFSDSATLDALKNTLILATKKQNQNPDAIKKYKEQYEEALYFIMGCDAKDYLKEIKNI